MREDKRLSLVFHRTTPKLEITRNRNIILPLDLLSGSVIFITYAIRDPGVILGIILRKYSKYLRAFEYFKYFFLIKGCHIDGATSF